MSPIEDPQDILIVQNIDTDCPDVTTETFIVENQIGTKADGSPLYSREEVIDVWKHADFFQVRYDKKPFRLAPGETRKMPRYLASHYAKYLCDHMLMKLEEETGKQFLVSSPTERPIMMAKIILGVDQYFLEQSQPNLSSGDRLTAQVDQLNADDGPTLNLEADVPVAPVETPEIPDVKEEEPKETSLTDSSKPLPTINTLRQDCKKMGIPFSLKDNKEELAAKIRAF